MHVYPHAKYIGNYTQNILFDCPNTKSSSQVLISPISLPRIKGENEYANVTLGIKSLFQKRNSSINCCLLLCNNINRILGTTYGDSGSIFFF